MKELTILHLYPKDMNLYGDHGNVLTLQRRLEWRGVTANVITYNVGNKFPAQPDIIFGGGGQDSGQDIIAKDLQTIAPKLKRLVEANTPTLTICGMYQMFGRFFKTLTGEVINGISIFDIETIGGNERLIGNIITQSDQFGEIIGYENHSGKTYLGKNAVALAKVKMGAGNNDEDGLEGVIYKNAIGTYLHGPLLPKNPRIADFLIAQALQNKYGKAGLTDLDDSLIEQARAIAKKRPR
ncbi:glutamine amidotransferase [Candidatus Saccharibacteria bacterium]|nr:glutamine amidotransferase [Candidatus Saccharibacteria bacterium]